MPFEFLRHNLADDRSCGIVRSITYFAICSEACRTFYQFNALLGGLLAFSSCSGHPGARNSRKMSNAELHGKSTKPEKINTDPTSYPDIGPSGGGRTDSPGPKKTIRSAVGTLYPERRFV